MVELVKWRMPRQLFSCYSVTISVSLIILFLVNLAAAERPFLRREAGGGLTRVFPKSSVGQSGDATSSMIRYDQDTPWFEGLENLSRRIFLKNETPHWPVLKLTQVRTILGIILGGIGAGLAGAGGLGGGGIYVPLFNLMLQFDPKTSAALSNFMILGGCVVNLIINLQQHHPVHRSKPVIDFDVLLLMQPNMMLGISIGVIFNVILPAWFITAALAIVLGYMTIHSIKGGLKRWRRETQQNHERREALESQSESPVSSTMRPTEDEVAVAPKLSFKAISYEEGNGTNSLKEPLLESKTESPPRTRLIPIKKVAALVVVWLAFFSVQVLRGGKGGQSVLGFEQCGTEYWVLTSAQLPLAVVLTAWTINQLCHCHGVPYKHNPKAIVIQDEGYVVGPEAATIFPWMALVAGVLGGMLGVGGGMIINPLLYTVGMLPQVTAATCASMVFFSSSMSVIQYWLLGRIPVLYALISAVLCGISTWFGIVIVHKAITKYNRASLIVFSVAAVMGVSAILMCGFGGWDLWKQYQSGAYMGFHNPC